MAESCEGNDAFWRECTAWLTRLNVLRHDHRATLATANISDLANTLRDGAVLCKLLYRLDPNCIDMKVVNLKPAMARFLCLRNIELFVKNCEKFGLRDSDLFESSMLFDLTNFHKVLCSLSKLSQTPRALRHNIVGFSAQNERSEDEEVYQSLKSAPDNHHHHRRTNNFVVDDMEHYFQDGCNEFREEIYQDLCSVKNTVTLDLQPMEKRDYVIKELVDTEKNYVDVLSKLQKNFMEPLRPRLAPDVYSTIFYKIDEMYEIHKDFLKKLLKVNSEKQTKLSNTFMNFRDRFLIYGEYCSKLSQACSKIQEICENDEELNDLIISFEKEDNNGKFKLRDVLSVPMQRILKYHLLLEKLTDSTDQNHEEYKELLRARDAMVDVAGYINEVARDYEHREVLKKLKENMYCEASAPIDLEDYGHLLLDGEVRVKSHDDNKTRNRYVFIFDKCMLLCKQTNKNAFQFRESLVLVDYTVDDAHNRALLNQSGRWAYQWNLVKRHNSNCFTFSVRSIELKSKMIKAIKEAKENVTPTVKTSHRFEIYTFREPTVCHRCGKYLKGLIFQGYRCLVCRSTWHKDCLSQSGRCGHGTITGSSGSLSSALLPPPTPPPPPLPIEDNTAMQEQLWYAGEVNRLEATNLLEPRLNGTFLVRLRSSDGDDNGRFALSLKTDGNVKHMKICCNINGSQKKYYLSLSRYFNSIEELIENYQYHSLRENFDRLEEHTKLELPYKLIRCKAIKHFISTNNNEVSVEDGQTVLVIKKNGYLDGFWKGMNNIGIGYFPKCCVLEMELTTDESLMA